jgi:hypothetical protein
VLHVSCKHCGKTVEIGDLLAAAEQPCPHCGKPILDDSPPVPTAVPGQPGLPGRHFEDDPIVISRADALKTPPKVCIVCGGAGTQVARQWIYFTRNDIPSMLVPYCDRHYRKHLWLFTGKLVFGLVVAFFGLFTPPAI